MVDPVKKLNPPAPFKIDATTRLEDWQHWTQKYMLYAFASNLNQQSHDVQLTAFKSLVGSEAMKIYDTLSLSEATDVASVVRKFDEHFGNSRFNSVLERWKLYKLSQNPGQRFEGFLEAVTNQVDKCGFGSMRDDMVLYKIVGGIADEDVRNALLAIPNLNCETAIKICTMSSVSHFMTDVPEVSCNTEYSEHEKTSERVSKRKYSSNNVLNVQIPNKKAKIVNARIPKKQDCSRQSRAKRFTKAVENENELTSMTDNMDNTKNVSNVNKSNVITKILNAEEINDRITKMQCSPNRNVEPNEKPVSQDSGPTGEDDVTTQSCESRNEVLPSKASVRVHHVLGKIYGCYYCQGKKRFKQRAFLSRHIHTKHPDLAVTKQKNELLGEPVSCTKCPLEFRVAAALRVHELFHMSPGERELRREEILKDSPYRHLCDLCGKVFTEKRGVRLHHLSHTGEKPFACNHCDFKTAYQGTLTVHIRRKHPGDKPLACKHCDFETTSSSSLDNHVKVEHSDVRPHVCRICGVAFKLKKELKSHILAGHPGEKAFACQRCDFKTNQSSEFNLHTKIKHAELDSSSKQNLPRFTCDECGYQTYKPYYFKKHKFTHSAEKPLKCDLCDYSCTTIQQWKAHKVFRHAEGDLKEVSCTKCTMKFKVPDALKAHMLSHMSPEERKKHGAELLKNTVYSHPCDQCGKVFTSSSGLASHMYNHTGEKPFACELCDFKTVQKSTLKVHVRIKHTNEKPFMCSTCGESFKKRGNLNEHMAIHTDERPFECDVCGAKFKRKKELNTHKIIHTSEKPFACDLCDYRCQRKCHMKQHMRVHRHQLGESSLLCKPKQKKAENNRPMAPAPLNSSVPSPPPAPSGVIPQWSEHLPSIGSMECSPGFETPPFHPFYPVHSLELSGPQAGGLYSQQRNWPGQS